MKSLFALLLGTGIVSVALVPVSTPAYALGGCGGNAHRAPNGQCVRGGQNQGWCEKQTGHPATHMRDGTWRCI
jgi:hypothetical protein